MQSYSPVIIEILRRLKSLLEERQVLLYLLEITFKGGTDLFQDFINMRGSIKSIQDVSRYFVHQAAKFRAVKRILILLPFLLILLSCVYSERFNAHL